jgi:ankyrin repeat protein
VKEESLELALFVAVGRSGSRETAEALLQAGAKASFRQKGRGGWTTRMQAFDAQPDLLPLLLGHPHVGLMDAAIDGDLAATQMFLEHGASPNELDCYGQKSAVSYAAHLGHVEIVALLLRHGANPNVFRDRPWNSPLVAALQMDHLACADLLWSAGARAERLIEHVVSKRAPDSALAWVAAHEPSSDLEAALHIAIKYRHLSAVKWLIGAGAQPNQLRFGKTPLMTAAHHGYEEGVRFLLELGVDLHATDRRGFDALCYAISFTDIEDPEQPFEYRDEALRTPIAVALLREGLVPPQRR